MERIFDRAAILEYLKSQVTDRMVRAVGETREKMYEAFEHADDAELLEMYLSARGAQSRNRALRN